jgi:hypothetical protein
MDWNITGDINNKGSLDLYANLYYRKGIDTTLNLTNANTELSSPLLTEQGTISNQVFGHSQAQTNRTRYATEISDQESIDDYGPLQINQTYLGRQDQASINNSAQSRVDKRGRPVYIIQRNALDFKRTFDYLDIGNIVSVRETSVGFNANGGLGFDGKARILSISYNDLSNKAPLNLDVVEKLDIDYGDGIPASAILWDDNSVMQWDDNSTIEWDN